MVLYHEIREGVFLARPNRFMARVWLDGAEAAAHVKNTGRCREILRPGVKVILAAEAGAERKTRFSLVAAYKGDRLINIDSQAPNAAAFAALSAGRVGEVAGVTELRREVRFGTSRFDFFFAAAAGSGFVEVKGVTPEEGGIARFPDAPTERGRKHLQALAGAVRRGFRGCVLFMIQMEGVSGFAPNRATDPAFAAELELARQAGVEILAYDARVAPHNMELGRPVPVIG